ncbi:MAG: UDP-N-acetylglucosamine 1-carboxyvinyltransferase [Planctomycetia bacterium]|nr:UDP-N-acetylglucosamine 1-carboxyvinyltransferase [Planctomycetia bacterium]
MDAFRILGGRPLSGTVDVSGSKNAALPIVAATILADGPVRLDRVPDVADVRTLAMVLARLGVGVHRNRVGQMHLENIDRSRVHADPRLVRRMRASFCVLGPLVARRRRAIVPLPGGCAIGDRPVDLHLAGLAALGADIRLRNGCVVAEARRLVGAPIHLAGPRGPTVTGTANVMSAATLARGTTVITAAATEPELVDLGRFLVTLGAKIEGLGTPTIEIQGVDQLGGGAHRVIPDRIEAATLAIAAAASRGEATVRGAAIEHMAAVLAKLDEMGVRIDARGDAIHVRAADRPRTADVVACPYPGIPTDVQPQLMALAAVGPGRGQFVDRVFPDRFHHVRELKRLGARIRGIPGGGAVRGVHALAGAPVTATDLRAGAALVLAGLAAEGVTLVRRIGHLDRGYERLDEKLNRLGASIERTVVVPHGSADQLAARATSTATVNVE